MAQEGRGRKGDAQRRAARTAPGLRPGRWRREVEGREGRGLPQASGGLAAPAAGTFLSGAAWADGWGRRGRRKGGTDREGRAQRLLGVETVHDCDTGARHPPRPLFLPPPPPPPFLLPPPPSNRKVPPRKPPPGTPTFLGCLLPQAPIGATIRRGSPPSIPALGSLLPPPRPRTSLSPPLHLPPLAKKAATRWWRPCFNPHRLFGRASGPLKHASGACMFRFVRLLRVFATPPVPAPRPRQAAVGRGRRSLLSGTINMSSMISAA